MKTLAGAEVPLSDRAEAAPSPLLEAQAPEPPPGRAARRLEARRQRRVRLACAGVLTALVAATGAALNYERSAGGGPAPHPTVAKAANSEPSVPNANGGR